MLFERGSIRSMLTRRNAQTKVGDPQGEPEGAGGKQSIAAKRDNQLLTSQMQSSTELTDEKSAMASTWDYSSEPTAFKTERTAAERNLRRAAWMAALLFCLLVWGVVVWLALG